MAPRNHGSDGCGKSSSSLVLVLVLVLVPVLRGREAVRSSSSPYRPPGSEDEDDPGDEISLNRRSHSLRRSTPEKPLALLGARPYFQMNDFPSISLPTAPRGLRGLPDSLQEER